MSEKVTALEMDMTEVRHEAETTRKTLKDLREEVKSLRSQLEDTEVGTESFTDTLDELTRKQQELTNVTKSGVAAQTGSYNDLVNQMAILKKEWRATADEAERAALGDKIANLNGQLKEMDATLGNHQRNVGNYTAALEGANVQLDNQNDLFLTSINSAKGLLGAYQLFEGVLQTFGIESEEATEAIRKMQAILAMTEGLRSISEGVTAFKQLRVAINATSLASNGLKTALIGTGIGALVVLVGTLIANWEKVSKLWGGDTSPKTLQNKIDGLNDSIKETEDLFKNSEQTIQIKYRQALIDAKGDVEKLKKAEKELADEVERNTRSKLTHILAEARRAEAEAWADYLKFSQKSLVSADKKREMADLFNEIKDARIKAEQDLALFEQGVQIDKMKAEEEANQQRLEKHNEYLSSLNESMKSYGLKGIGDDAFITPKERLDKGLADLKTYLDNKLMTEEQYLSAVEELRARYDKETIGNISDAIGQISIADTVSKEVKVSEKTMEDLNKFVKEQNDKAAEERKKAQEAEERTQQRKIDVANATMCALSDIMKQGSAEQKAVQVAQTLMNTYTAAMGAAKDTTGPAWLRIAAIATVVAAGLAQVKNILSVNPEGETEGRASSSTISTPSASALSLMSNGIQPTTVVNGASVEEDIKDTKVYVLESDITTAQKNVKATVEEATY
jgi:DNA repair exonuclease SbcCD ATPase subunit